ncbi:MAG: winged helix-turn-helix transcriptional regulator [Clostridia bacterium]|nr:winged helix-turn-helix transcriptional regulator [Clostridia bacterium]
MFEKNLSLSFLLDQYGPVLGERHRLVLDYYYNQDLSLAEIAAEVGISRQGVRDSIKKAEEELFFLEERLHLHERAMRVAAASEQLLSMPLDAEARRAAEALAEAAGHTVPPRSETH